MTPSQPSNYDADTPVVVSATQKLPVPRSIITSEQVPCQDDGLSSHHLREKLDSIPSKPGVYLMRDKSQRVIYVGKSKCLYNRVRSYFRAGTQHTSRIDLMVSQVNDFEIIVVSSELEALLLENTLIKQYRPYFNVLFRDDKSYPMLEITVSETYPRVRVTRSARHNGSAYFGPYADGSALRDSMSIMKKVFRLRTCKHNIDKPLRRACLDHHMHLCTAPCTRLVSPKEYRQQVSAALDFLNGRSNSLISDLHQQLEKEATLLNYERCAVIRDMLQGLNGVLAQQKVLTGPSTNEDYVTLVADANLNCAVVWQVRQGKLLGQRHFLLDSRLNATAQDTMQAFLQQYYGSGALPPGRLVVSILPSDYELTITWLNSLRGKTVEMRVPSRGQKRGILNMATANAQDKLDQELLVPSRSQVRLEALQELGQALALKQQPVRMECMDISNTQGKQPVGSMVVFEYGLPHRTHYRHFKIRSMETPNDFAMMREMLERRFKHALACQKRLVVSNNELLSPIDDTSHSIAENGVQTPFDASLSTLPDLLIVDGGKGQLGVAVEVLERLGLRSRVALAGLAKKQEELFLPGQEQSVCLPVNSPAYLMVTHMRDEAHRFAITHHRKLRQKTVSKSLLDKVPGLGRVRKKAILLHFSDMRNLLAADIEAIKRVPGLGPELAERLYQELHG